ncbi:MAG: gamma-glutamyltransferase [Acidobacteriota bacterium]
MSDSGCLRVVMSVVLGFGLFPGLEAASAPPVRARRAMVVSQSALASKIGIDILKEGGNAIDAAVATAFAMAVTHPTAGNIGGGGFIVYRPAAGETASYDFREMAPAKAFPEMFLRDGRYDEELHHYSHLSIGVPGTVAGLHLAWRENGRLPWKRLVEPAIKLARDGFEVSQGLSDSLKAILPRMRKYPASVAQFSKQGTPYEPGEVLRQPDLGRTLERIAIQGPAGFYEGETAELIEKEMAANGGLISRDDLKRYKARRRPPVRGSYRGVEVISMPPPSSGGTILLEMLNILESFELDKLGFGSAAQLHLVIEAMRRGYADRARHLGDPESDPDMPVPRLISKEYAAALVKTIRKGRASPSSPTTFEWPPEGASTTHISVVDADRNAAALTYTLESGYGSRIVVPGAGFLLNNEMGDFNAGPGLTTEGGLIGTKANLAGPGKRMLSSMTPTILVRDGKLFMVTGSPGGRTIINTVLQTILNVVDFGMNVQEAVDAPRIHHQWLPDRVSYERHGLSPDTVSILASLGHSLTPVQSQGVVEAIVYDPEQDLLQGGCDRRAPDGAAAGW